MQRGLIIAALSAAALMSAAISPAAAAPKEQGATLERVRSAGKLRVCIWPAYQSITYRHPHTGQLSGIDIDLSAELARDLRVAVEYVDSSFAQLIDDVEARRCDVAMFAIGMLPARKERLAFTQPYLQSDIYGMTTRSNRVVREWTDIDKPGVVVAVQAGTFMEPVMREALKKAQIAVIRPPQTREAELEAGRVDVFMTDYPYSRRLLDNADWVRLVAPPRPFHVLPYAYATVQGDAEWLGTLDAFVARIKADGRLRNAARRHGLEEIVVR